MIVHLRRTLRMTGAAIAAKLGLARSTVSRWPRREGLGRFVQIDPPDRCAAISANARAS
ncbi:helix-turn-helix domain-containing protein [Rhodobacter capsulatus]|uniref:helix-turn-helix domain-containing protein n=1 Tax=Rhodobacter capsulatus TaxID=1061 RepID=UPI001F516827|nr:helix-turn-helix domain-containing protein [Rhodobacter capsulatus]